MCHEVPFSVCVLPPRRGGALILGSLTPPHADTARRKLDPSIIGYGMRVRTRSSRVVACQWGYD